MTFTRPIPTERQALVHGELIDADWYRFLKELETTLSTGALGALGSLDNTLGLVTQTGVYTFAKRTIVSNATLLVTNGDGVAANPSIALNLANPNVWTAQQQFTGVQVPVYIAYSDDTAGAGPITDWYRVSASPAAGDLLTYLRFAGNNSIGTPRNYNQIANQLDDPTNGSEDSTISFLTYVAGGIAERWRMSAGLYYSGGTDPGAGKINAIGYSVSGTDLFARGNTWTATQTFGSQFIPIALTYTDAGAAGGPALWSDRASSSPAAADSLGEMTQLGRNSSATQTGYTTIGSTITDPTAGSEDAEILLRTYVAGGFGTRWAIGAGLRYAGGTDPGANAINATAYQVSGTDLFARANTWTVGQQIQGQDAISAYWLDNGAAVGPQIHMQRASASPAAGDVIGQFDFQGSSSTGVNRNYAAMTAIIQDPTNASEDAVLYVYTQVAGTSATRFYFGSGFCYSGGADPGVNAINAVNYYNSGTKVVGNRATGWAAATNTKTRTTFDTTTVTLPILAAHVGALIDDLITHGLIGA